MCCFYLLSLLISQQTTESCSKYFTLKNSVSFSVDLIYHRPRFMTTENRNNENQLRFVRLVSKIHKIYTFFNYLKHNTRHNPINYYDSNSTARNGSDSKTSKASLPYHRFQRSRSMLCAMFLQFPRM